MERTLRRPVSRSAQPADVTVTLSENAREFLVVAEIRRGTERDTERIVEMISYRPGAAVKAARPGIEKLLLWEQADAILDLQVIGDEMLVLDTAGITRYARRATGWEAAGTAVLTQALTVRDPRGRLETSDGALTAYLPGRICRGAWKPALDVTCETSDAAFSLDNELVRFTANRNTLEIGGLPAFYSYARTTSGARAVALLSEAGGTTRFYDVAKNDASKGDARDDAAKKPLGSFDGWGSDFVAIENACGAGRQFLASSNADRQSPDSIALYEITDRRPIQVSDKIEFQGPIAALWPASGGALVVTHAISPVSSGSYAAYSLTVDCRR